MRASDLQLVALAFAAGVGVAGAAVVRERRRIGALVVVVALAVAGWLDRAVVHAVPTDSLGHLGPWLLPALVAALVVWAAGQLPETVPPDVSPVLLLTGASLAGVWAGVPETSAALLGLGVLGGVGVVVLVRGAALSRLAIVVVALVPVAATVVGAVGNQHALVGGLLCSATVVFLGAVPPPRPIARGALVVGTAVHLATVLVAARHVGVSRDWGDAVVWIPVSLVLAAVAATILRRGVLGRSTRLLDG